MISLQSGSTQTKEPLLNWRHPPSAPSAPVVRVVTVPRAFKSCEKAVSHVRAEVTRVMSDAQPLAEETEIGIRKKAQTSHADKRITPTPDPKPRIRASESPPTSKKRALSDTASSVKVSSSKRARSSRLSSRRQSPQIAGYRYTPPPKRARSQHPFGSRECAIPRTCFNNDTGDVVQTSSKDVIQRLISTYKSCKISQSI
jgi:hypothetical protein